jgi:hypothetical protein
MNMDSGRDWRQLKCVQIKFMACRSRSKDGEATKREKVWKEEVSIEAWMESLRGMR